MALDHSERVMLSWNCFKALPDSTRDDRSKKFFFVFQQQQQQQMRRKELGREVKEKNLLRGRGKDEKKHAA